MTLAPVSRELRRAAVCAALGVLIAACAAARPAHAQGLAACAQSGSHPGYKLHLDGALARAYAFEEPSELVMRRLGRRLAGDLASLGTCSESSTGLCPPRPNTLLCAAREPRAISDFDPPEIARLDEARVVLESWVKVTSDEDDEGRPLHLVRLSCLLVPVAASSDGLPPGANAFITLERRIPQEADRRTTLALLALDHEYRVLSRLCAGLKRMRARQYDDAHAYLAQALGACGELTDPARRAALAEAEALARALAWENLRRARADAANRSEVSLTGDEDFAAALGGAP